MKINPAALDMIPHYQKWLHASDDALREAVSERQRRLMIKKDPNLFADFKRKDPSWMPRNKKLRLNAALEQFLTREGFAAGSVPGGASAAEILDHAGKNSAAEDFFPTRAADGGDEVVIPAGATRENQLRGEELLADVDDLGGMDEEAMQAALDEVAQDLDPEDLEEMGMLDDELQTLFSQLQETQAGGGGAAPGGAGNTAMADELDALFANDEEDDLLADGSSGAKAGPAAAASAAPAPDTSGRTSYVGHVSMGLFPLPISAEQRLRAGNEVVLLDVDSFVEQLDAGVFEVASSSSSGGAGGVGSSSSGGGLGAFSAVGAGAAFGGLLGPQPSFAQGSFDSFGHMDSFADVGMDVGDGLLSGAAFGTGGLGAPGTVGGSGGAASSGGTAHDRGGAMEVEENLPSARAEEDEFLKSVHLLDEQLPGETEEQLAARLEREMEEELAAGGPGAGDKVNTKPKEVLEGEEDPFQGLSQEDPFQVLSQEDPLQGLELAASPGARHGVSGSMGVVPTPQRLSTARKDKEET